MEGTSVEAYADSSRFLVAMVRRVSESEWSAPGLGSWTVLELVAHANRGHTTVEDYLLRPQAQAPAGGDYFSDEAIAQRGRAAVNALGTDPAAAIAADSERVLSLVRSAPGEATLGSPMMTTTLAAYLPSRTAELTIHGLDLANALRIEAAAPASAIGATLAFVAERCLSRDPEQVIRALTGRGELPSGYSVY